MVHMGLAERIVGNHHMGSRDSARMACACHAAGEDGTDTVQNAEGGIPGWGLLTDKPALLFLSPVRRGKRGTGTFSCW